MALSVASGMARTVCGFQAIDIHIYNGLIHLILCDVDGRLIVATLRKPRASLQRVGDVGGREQAARGAEVAGLGTEVDFDHSLEIFKQKLGVDGGR